MVTIARKRIKEIFMEKYAYLSWMAENTPSQWCNDSAITEDIEAALANGAVGCTSNPPLTYEVLTAQPELFRKEMDKIPKDAMGDDRAAELIGVVVRHIAAILYDIYEKSGGKFGYIRAQVQPDLSADAEAMLNMGKMFASWGKNIKVKIPGTAAGIWVLEELAALGIPTNPTVCVTVSQIIAAAEANERGIQRAAAAGIQPAQSTSAIVMGRLQDYLTKLNEQRGTGLSFSELSWASLAVVKKSYHIFTERGYSQVLMPAAFRCAMQVEQLAGSKVEMTIHPKVQSMLNESDAEGLLCRENNIDKPVDEDAVERVRRALLEFGQAMDEDGLAIKDFDTFGATEMTLHGFDITGWQKLKTL